MKNTLSGFFDDRGGIVLAGAVIGVLAPLLQFLGNPANMGICVACFERDIAGALGLHRADVVQYIRPEIIGFVLGAFVSSLLFGEFKARAGSSPLARFILGLFAMIGSLAFLGCPWRAILRLAGGDLNAILGLAGLTFGIIIGIGFLKTGFSLGRARETGAAAGLIMPALMLGLFLLLVLRPQFSPGGPIFFSAKGPGSQHAPLFISLAAGLLIGFLAQRTRFCTMGAIRDVILIRDPHLFSGIVSLLVTAVVVNLVLGQTRLGFAAQPVSHSNHLWNFLGMTLAGLAFCLAGGCPGRQLFLSGEGNTDSGVFVLGMITGAAFAHNFATAGRADALVNGVLKVGGISPAGMIAVLLGLAVCVVFGLTLRDRAA